MAALQGAFGSVSSGHRLSPSEGVVGTLGKVAQVNQCGVDVLQAHWAVRRCTGCLDARSGDHKGYIGSALPQRTFVPMLFFAEVKAVVRKEDDEGVVGMVALFKGR